MRLDNILILGKKIHVNLPRYVRGEERKKGEKVYEANGNRARNGVNVERSKDNVFAWRRKKIYATSVGDSGPKSTKNVCIKPCLNFKPS